MSTIRIIRLPKKRYSTSPIGRNSKTTRRVELEMQLWSPGMQAYTGSQGGSFLPQNPGIRRDIG
jgi:hypothetical protein